MSETFEMVAKTLYGLEEILAGELLSLGANDIQIGRRMVSFTGDKEVLYKANFYCRTALRILKHIYHFKAKGASWISQKTVPLSSGGRKDLGTVSNSFQLPTRTAASRISVSHARRTMMPAHLI